MFVLVIVPNFRSASTVAMATYYFAFSDYITVGQFPSWLFAYSIPSISS